MFVKLFGLLVMWLTIGFVTFFVSAMRHSWRTCNGNWDDLARYTNLFAEIAKQYSVSSWQGYGSDYHSGLIRVLNAAWNWVTWPSLVPYVQDLYRLTDERWIGIKNES